MAYMEVKWCVSSVKWALSPGPGPCKVLQGHCKAGEGGLLFLPALSTCISQMLALSRWWIGPPKWKCKFNLGFSVLRR